MLRPLFPVASVSQAIFGWGVDELVHALQTSDPSIASVNLSHTDWDTGSLVRIADALAANTSCHDLNWQYANVDDEVGQRLANALCANQTLRSLNLRFNFGISDLTADRLANALEVNRTLTIIELEDTSVTDAGARRLGEVAKRRRTLEVLSLPGESVMSNVTYALKFASLRRASVSSTTFRQTQNNIRLATLTLARSNFKKYYDQAVYIPTKREFFMVLLRFMLLFVRKRRLNVTPQAIEALVTSISQQVDATGYLEPGAIAACAWTSDAERGIPPVRYYSSLNCTIREDDDGEIMQLACRVVRTQNLYVVNRAPAAMARVQWPLDGAIKRGTWMPDQELEFFSIGSDFRAPQCMVGSKERGVATRFMEDFRPNPVGDKVPVMFLIQIDDAYKCCHANYFEDLTLIHNEFEYMLPPYSAFCVVDCVRPAFPTPNDPVVVSLYAHPDCKQCPEDWPLSHWM